MNHAKLSNPDSEPIYRQFHQAVTVGGPSPMGFPQGCIFEFQSSDDVPETLARHSTVITFKEAALSGVRVSRFDAEVYRQRTTWRPEPPEPELIPDDDLIERLSLSGPEQLEVLRREGHLRATHQKTDGTKLTPETAILPYREWLASVTGQPQPQPARGWLR